MYTFQRFGMQGNWGWPYNDNPWNTVTTSSSNVPTQQSQQQAQAPEQQQPDQEKKEMTYSETLQMLAAIAQLAAALRKPPKQKNPIYHGPIGQISGVPLRR